MPPSSKTLNTPHLHLRAFEPSDNISLHRSFSDPLVMQYWSTAAHTTLAQTTTWLARTLASPTNGVLEFVITLSGAPHDAIGKVGVWDAERGEVGLLLERAHWHRGVMGEALAALLGLCFGEKGQGRLESVVGDVDPRNGACRRVLEKAGFVEEGEEKGTWCVEGVWVDSVYYRLTRERWRAMHRKDREE